MSAAQEEIWRKVCGILMHHLGVIDVTVKGEDIAKIPDNLCVLIGGAEGEKDLRLRLMTTGAARKIGAIEKRQNLG